MRTRLIAVGVLLAVAAAAAASVGDAARGQEARRPTVVSYLVEVTFALHYHVEWTLKSGTRADPCDSWGDDAGTNSVFVHNQGRQTTPKKLKPLPGQLSFGLESVFGQRLNPGWAALNVVGEASGSVSRLWLQRGGPTSTPCNGRPVSPFVAKPDDCARVSFSTESAIVRAEFRKDTSDLFQLTRSFLPGKGQAGKPVLAVSVPLGNGSWALPFAKCETTASAPELVYNIGLPVDAADIRSLRTLGEGKTHRMTWSRKTVLTGPCDRDDVLDHDRTCTFRIQGWVAIRHVKPNPYKR